MGNEVRIKASVTGNAKQEIAGIRDAWNRFQKEGGQGVKAGLTAAAAVKGFDLLQGAIGGAIGVMDGAVDAASNLNETLAKSGVVFKGNADDVEAWGDTTATSLGLSKDAAISAAAGFGDLFNKVGITADTSVEMSQRLVTLSADLASFNNLAGGSQEALEKIRSGLAGETEPLRSLGVFLNEAKVKSKAAELGLMGLNGELTEGAKIQARYALILEETASAQGDFARTSDQLANKRRINDAKLADSMAKLGNIILPAVTNAAGDLSSALDGLSGVLGILNGELPETEDGWEALTRRINDLNPLHAAWANTLDDAQEKYKDAQTETARYDEMLLRLNETTAETTARLLEQGKAADGTREDLEGLKVQYDAATGFAEDMAGALLEVADGARASASKTRDAEQAAEDLEDALDDLTDAAYDAARAFGDQAYDADQLKGRMAELEREIGDAKKELRELEAIKNPTKDQQTDIVILRGKLAGLREDLFGTRIDLAKLDGTGLDSLLKELANAQYRTDLLGDEAREALDLFRKLSFAAKNAPGYRSDPGYAPRAKGGPVSEGTPYWVGEEGKRELFVPETDGAIYTEAQVGNMGGGGGWGGGGPTVIVNVHAQGVMTPAIAQQLRDELGPVLAPLFARR